MSHRWDCPSDSDARRKARSDADYDFNYGHGREYGRRPYGCDDANRAYGREYEREAYLREELAEEERRAANRRERRRQEEAAKQAYWDEEYRQRQEEQERYEAYLANEQWTQWAVGNAFQVYQTGDDEMRLATYSQSPPQPTASKEQEERS